MEEVCRKQNLKAEDFDLKHHNKILDTSAIFRFSGLPNNAQLELAPVTKVRLESDIILAVNLENGNRLVENFTPSQTLVGILEQLCPEYLSGEKSPVVIYMRQEIFGKKLETVTLRSLGITGGRAMIRVIDKAPENLKVQANVAVPLPHKPVEEKPYVRKFKESFPEEGTNVKLDNENETKSDVKVDNENINSKNFKKGGTADLIKLAKEKRKNTDYSSNNEKRPNFSSNIIERNDVNKSIQEEVLQTKICQCKKSGTMDVDCCGKCDEICTNLTETNLEDQFVFVSSIGLNI